MPKKCTSKTKGTTINIMLQCSLTDCMSYYNVFIIKCHNLMYFLIFNNKYIEKYQIKLQAI